MTEPKVLAPLVIITLLLGACGAGDTKKDPRFCYGVEDCPSKAYLCQSGACVRGGGTECEQDETCTSPPNCQSAVSATCVGGYCQYPALDCDDGIGCTEDLCDMTSGLCQNTPEDLLCDESPAGVCDPILDCQYFDIEPPRVVSSYPAPDTRRVARRASLTVDFSEPMDPATIDGQSFTLRVVPPEELFDQITTSGDRTYAVTRKPLNWHEADVLATRLGGHLVSIGDADENDFLNSTFSPDYNGSMWIGLSDDTVEWSWASGEPYAYTHWDADPGTGPCVTISGANGTWEREGCAEKRRTLVEWGPAPATVTMPTSTQARLEPAASLWQGNTYEVVLSPAVSDLAGNRLAAAYTARFTTPSTRGAVVASLSAGTVAALEIQAASGLPRHCGYEVMAAAGSGPTILAARPQGDVVYALNATQIAGYTLDQYGRLVLLPNPVSLTITPSAAIVSPDGKNLYVMHQSGNAITTLAIDQTTLGLSVQGALTIVSPRALVAHPNGLWLYAVANDKVIERLRRDQTTGVLTDDGEAASGVPFEKLALHPGGELLLAATGAFEPDPESQPGYYVSSLRSLRIEPTSGALSVLEDHEDFQRSYYDLAFDPAGRFVYTIYVDSSPSAPSTINWLALDEESGALTEEGHYATNPVVSLSRLRFDPRGDHAYVHLTNDSNVTTLLSFVANPRTGALYGDPRPMLTHHEPRDLVFFEGDSPLVYVPRFAVTPSYGVIKAFPIDSEDGSLASGMTWGTLPTTTGQNEVAVDPFGRFVFVTNSDNMSVYAYAFEEDTLVLREPSSETSGFPRAIAVHPSGRKVYVGLSTGGSNNYIETFNVADDGTLTRSGSSLNTSGYPTKLAVDASGRFLFAADYGAGNIWTYPLEVITGQPQAPTISSITLEVCVSGGGANASVNTITTDPVGPFVYAAVRDGSLHVLEYATDNGALTQRICEGSQTLEPAAVMALPAGNMVFVGGATDQDLSGFTVAPSIYEGMQTVVELTPLIALASHPARSLAAEPSGRFFYSTYDFPDIITAFRVTPDVPVRINEQTSEDGTSTSIAVLSTLSP